MDVTTKTKGKRVVITHADAETTADWLWDVDSKTMAYMDVGLPRTDVFMIRFEG